MNNMKLIKFKDLSFWLKVAVVTSLIECGLSIISFFIGFVGVILYG